MQAIVIDDDHNFYPILKSELKKAGGAVGLDIELTAAHNVNELLATATVYDLYFIDIEMPEMNGLDLVNALRKKYVDKDFIFVSSHEKYMRAAFFVKPAAFIRKEYLCGDLEETLRFIKENQSRKQVTATLRDNKKEYSVNPHQIMYCESDSHYVKLFFAGGSSLLIRNKLSSVGESLSEFDFVRVHSRYLINLNFAENTSKKELTMRDGAKVPISDSYRAEALERIMRWFVDKYKAGQ